MSKPISHHEALIYLMVMMSAADSAMTDSELKMIGDIVTKFPVFSNFDSERLVQVAEDCGEVMSGENGIDAVLEMVEGAIPDKLRETAYAVAVEVAAADEKVGQEELRILELIRYRLRIDHLSAGAIERSARARHMTL